MAKAREHCARNLEIAERLAKLDSGNAVWRSDLEISRARMNSIAGK